MHFCHEEVLGIVAVVPFLRVWVERLRFWFHIRKNCPHPQDGVFFADQVERHDGIRGDQGWYFFDDHSSAQGPYRSRQKARKAASRWLARQEKA